MERDRSAAAPALVAETLTEDASYLDPLMSGEGIDGVSAMIAGAQQQYPGHRFALVAGPDAHHDRVRFSWSLTPDGGEPIAIGSTSRPWPRMAACDR